MKYITAWDAIKYAAGRKGVTPSGQDGPAVGMSYAWLLATIGFLIGLVVGRFLI